MFRICPVERRAFVVHSLVPENAQLDILLCKIDAHSSIEETDDRIT